MISKRLLSFIIASFICISGVAISGCSKKTSLDSYSLDEVKIKKDIDATDLYYEVGGASFMAMQIKEGDYLLKYRVYLPENAEKAKNLPVMLFMHGAGERGDNNLSQIGTYTGMQTIFKEKSPALDGIIIVPQCPENKKWVDVKAIDNNVIANNYSVDELEETKQMSTVLKILKYYTQNYSVDMKRIYAMGMSMGGFATWDLLARHNDLIAAAIPICGGGDVSKVEVMKNTPIKTYHGVQDVLVSVESTREMYKALNSLNSPITYTEYVEEGHAIWNKVMEEGGLMDWLYSQKHY